MDIIGEWLCKSTVQVSILILLVMAVKLIVRNRLSARWQYWLWLVVLVRMVMPWVPQSSVSVFNLLPDGAAVNIQQVMPAEQYVPVAASETIVPAITEPVEAIANVSEIPAKAVEVDEVDSASEVVIGTNALSHWYWGKLAWFVWLGGVIVLAVQVFVSNFRFWWQVKGLRPMTDQGLLDLLEDCKGQMGIGTIVGVVVTDSVKSPALFGFLRPRLLLPTGMAEKLSIEQMRHVFLHELAHLKRCDIYVSWITAILQVVHWFNPLVWFAFYQMRADREMACDSLALSMMGRDKPSDYGRTIVSMLENYSQKQYVPAMAGILEERSQLKRRITMIARFKKNSYRWSPLAIVLLIVLGCIGIGDAKRKAEIVVEDNSPFTATLPNGVTAELLGICEYPSEDKQWWRPDGTPFSLPEGIKIEDRFSRDRVGDNAYQFLFSYNSQEDLKWNSVEAVCLHFAIKGHSDTNLINMKRLPKGDQDGLVAKVAIFKEPLDSTSVHANLATGNWQTKAVRNTSKIEQRDDDLYWFTSGPPEASDMYLDILHRIEGQQIKTIAIDRDGNEYTSSYSLGSFGGWMSANVMGAGHSKDDRMYHTGLRKDDRLVKFKLQSRKYSKVTIKNISLRPSVETDVQIDDPIEPTISYPGGKVNVVKGKDGPDVVVRKTPNHEGSVFYKNFTEQYLLELVSKCLDQEITKKVGRESSGDGSSPREVHKRIGFGVAFSFKGIERHKKTVSFKSKWRKLIKQEVYDIFGVYMSGGGEQLIYRTDDRVGTIILYLSPNDSDEDILQIKVMIQEVITSEVKTDVQIATSNHLHTANPQALGVKAEVGSKLEFRIVANLTPEQAKEIVWPDSDLVGYKWLPLVSQVKNSKYVNLPHRRINDTVYLLVSEVANETMLADGSWGLEKTFVTNNNNGHPAVYIWFDESGSQKFLAITKNNIERSLAICIDGEINSAPTIMTAISKRAIITGNFTEEQAAKLAESLQKGMLPKSTPSPEETKTAVLLPSIHQVLDLSTGKIIDVPIEKKSQAECLAYIEQNCGCGIMFDHDGDMSHLGFINVLHVDRHTKMQSGIKMMSFVSKNMPQEVVVTANDGKRYRIQITKAENEGAYLDYHQLPSDKTGLGIDSDFDALAEPVLTLIPLPHGPEHKSLLLGIRAVGPTPQNPTLKNNSIAFPRLIVDGIERNLTTMTWTGPVAPLESGQVYTRILNLDGYEPAIEPGKEHTVKAIVGKYESATVIIPADDTLRPQWNNAMKKLSLMMTANEKLEKQAQGWVENFFRNNYRDITARKTLGWGKVELHENGNVSIRYKYEATIWDKDKVINNQIFTFDKAGKFVSVVDVKADDDTDFREALLPDIDGDSPKMLDLVTGELVDLPGQSDDRQNVIEAIEQTGKGHVVFDYNKRGSVLVLVRGTKSTDDAFKASDMTTPGYYRVDFQNDLKNQLFVVSTKDGTNFEVVIVSVSEQGCKLKWRKIGQSKASVLYNDWLKRIIALKTHKQAAFVVVPQLLEESDDLALRVAQNAWPEIKEYKVKQGILKAFHFAKHPDTLKVLDMGVHDLHGAVVAYALTYVTEYSGVKFAGLCAEYTQWYEENKGKALNQAIMDSKGKRHKQYDEIIEKMIAQIKKRAKRTDLWNYSQSLGEAKYSFAIPAMIGIIDADNSYDTVYGVGYFGLSKITGVNYSPFNDGQWWRRWWQQNKSDYPQQVQNVPIPDLPKTSHGSAYTPYPEDIDTPDGMIRWMSVRYKGLEQGYPSWSDVAEEFSRWQDAKAIPHLIAAMDADTSGRLAYDIGYHGLDRLTGVPYDQSHDADWWKTWWQKNKNRYSEEIQALDIEKIKQQYLRLAEN